METWLEGLSGPACRHELARSTVGRLAVVVDGKPEIFPVNHVYDPDSDAVIFPAHAGTKLRAALDSEVVAFEADGIDSGDRSAWSVVIHGRAREIDDPALIGRARAERTALWADDDRSHWLAIELVGITGRRISTIPATPVR